MSTGNVAEVGLWNSRNWRSTSTWRATAKDARAAGHVFSFNVSPVALTIPEAAQALNGLSAMCAGVGQMCTWEILEGYDFQSLNTASGGAFRKNMQTLKGISLDDVDFTSATDDRNLTALKGWGATIHEVKLAVANNDIDQTFDDAVVYLFRVDPDLVTLETQEADLRQLPGQHWFEAAETPQLWPFLVQDYNGGANGSKATGHRTWSQFAGG